MDSTCAVVGTRRFLMALAGELADVCTPSVGGWEETRCQGGRAESHRTRRPGPGFNRVGQELVLTPHNIRGNVQKCDEGVLRCCEVSGSSLILALL